MEIMQKIAKKAADLYGEKSPTIAFLGDSVTQGCFELYTKTNGDMETVFDRSSTYAQYLSDILAQLFPNVPVNIVNAGISGDRAPSGADRLERDVLVHRPDLTVVCYGLNDSTWGMDNLPLYTAGLERIFKALQQAGSECVFMTPNMMNPTISCHVHNTPFETVAKTTMDVQNSGTLTNYLEAGKQVAAACGVRVCDVYAKWQRLAANGVDVSELLANHINHPTRYMNRLFAYSLMETLLQP